MYQRFWVLAGTTLRAQIVGIAIFHKLILKKYLTAILLMPWRYFVFSLSRDLMWPVGQRNMWFHGCIHLTMLPTCQFHGHKPCQRGYATLLVCPVKTRHHVVRGSCDSIGSSDSTCHVTSRDYAMRGSSDIMGEFLSS